MAYGDFAGFLIAWGYWISIWTSLPVIAIAFAGAVMDLFPGLHNRPMAAALTLGAIWAVVLVNLRGVKAAGIFSEVTTYTKSVPFAGIILFGCSLSICRTSANLIERQIAAQFRGRARPADNVRLSGPGVRHRPGG